MEPSPPLPSPPDLAAIEHACRDLWEREGIHRFQTDCQGEVFSVDTPPPYVSAAHLHVGHAMSYSQAEFIVRFRRMRGERVFYPMGLDDNGLPTERYVERKHSLSAKQLPRREFRALCLEETAAGAVRYEQLWRALGLSVDWSLRYSTIDEHSRRTAQRSFLELLESGRIHRAEDPVPWDPGMRTALSQADLETTTRTSTLYYVTFRGRDGRALGIATTRPELLAACVALYCHPDDPRHASRVGSTARVPMFGHEVPVLADHDVDSDYGTGLMMVCTFGDADDVHRWRRDGLATRTCLGEDGRLSAAAGPYAGLTSGQARARIVADLEAAGLVTGARQVTRHVPVSERSGTPVELMLRPQWFLGILDLKEDLLRRSAQLEWHPAWMRARLDDWIRGLRHDWNLSRQRSYGVPFPVWLCADCGGVVPATIADLPVEPTEQAAPHERCPHCGSGALAGDPDVMDTWMTSSLTPQILGNWAGSPRRTSPGPGPMTLRVQAYEIIRTWLFYTVVKSHLHHDTLPWTAVMISGWGLNEQGRRISKRDLDPTRPGTSARYDPAAVIDRYGADALRHWAAGSQLGHDLRYHERDVKAGRKVVLKVWNLARLVHSWDEGSRPMAALPVAERGIADRWLAHRVGQAVARATGGFAAFNYVAAREGADGLLWTMADDWAEIVKDFFRLPHRYPEHLRASALVTGRESLRTLLGLYAPFLPFVTEELYQRLYRQHEHTVSLHVTAWPTAGEAPAVPDMEPVLSVMRAVRSWRSAHRMPASQALQALIVDGREPLLASDLAPQAATIQAAVNAARVEFGPAGTATATPGLFIDIELSP